MPTREQVSFKIRQDLTDRGVLLGDSFYEFVLESMEMMNHGVADLDDEVADIAGRLACLAQAPTWINRRDLDQFGAFVYAKLAECEATLAAVRERWEKHEAEKPIVSRAPETP